MALVGARRLILWEAPEVDGQAEGGDVLVPLVKAINLWDGIGLFNIREIGL